MILDNHSRGQETGDRRQETGDRRQETGDGRQEATASIRHSPLVTRHSSLVTLRHRWVRLLLLVLAVGALSLIGALLGRGFDSGSAVVSQAIEPTSAPAATLAPQPPVAPMAVATAVPVPIP